MHALKAKTLGGPGLGFIGGGGRAEKGGDKKSFISFPVGDLLAESCRQRLRICVCLSPSDPHTPTLLRRFPMFASCCAINCFWNWSEQALYSVAQQKLQLLTSLLNHQEQLLHSEQTEPHDEHNEQSKTSSCNQPHERLEKLCEACAEIFRATGAIADCYRKEQRRFFYVTPSSYLQFLEGFCYVHINQASQQQQQQQQYELGLCKLRDVSTQVTEMQQQLETLRPQLVRASEETQHLMQALTVKQDHAATTMVSLNVY